MNALKWLREFGQQPVRPVYAVFGDDSYLIRESIRAVVRAVFPGEESDATISRFSGANATLAGALDEVCTLPFFSRQRLVIIDEADPFVSKYRKELEAFVDRPRDSGILLFQTKQWLASTKLAKLVEKVGLSIDCSGPREDELAGWLIQLARTRDDAELDPEAARLLVELIGPEVGILAAEVEKLAVYAGDSKRIERQDVAKLVGAGRVETIWKALDAATTGQGRTALQHLDNLLTSGEHPVGLLAAMSVSLLKLHHAGRLRTGHVNLDEACRMAGIPPFAVKLTHRQHAHLGPGRVDQLPAWLLQADLDLKGGSSLEPRVVLEQLVIRLASPRAD
jgi:DNA polymerase III subunit delta